jgi:hypothetical protein
MFDLSSLWLEALMESSTDQISTGRSVVVLLSALFTGLTAGILCYLAYHSVLAAILAGSNAARGAFVPVKGLIERYGTAPADTAQRTSGRIAPCDD